jgi:hypothetical protein
VDAPLTAHELVRPWRRATILASLVASVELVLLLGAVALLVAKPLSHAIQRHAESAALAPAKAKVRAAITPLPAPKSKPVPQPTHTRSSLAILVLNGNGRSGAAGTAAAKLHGLGYRVAATGNARRQDYATTVVLYRAGYEPEANRLARDLGVKVVGPLDGLKTAALHGGQLAVIVGA